MATVTLTIVAGGTTYGYTKTISSTDLQRLLDAYMFKYGTVDADSTGKAWAQQLLSTTAVTIRKYEEQAAVNSALSQISDITFT